MSALATTHPTLLDLANRLDPNGTVVDIVEMLNTTNEILDDMTWMEGNLLTGHRTTIRTGLPSPTWRKMYGGVQPTKSTTATITDNCGMLEDYAEVDKALADLNGNTAEFRLSEDKPHIEGIMQTVAQTLFYGDETLNPERFTGLSARYNSMSAENAENIIDAQGSGSDNASIWLVGWGPNTIHGIVPKGSKAGLQHEDKGQVTIENVDGNGGRMEAYRSHYRFDCGLTLRDWRYVVRIANIDRSDLSNDLTSGADLNDLMVQALQRIQSLQGVKPVFYMDRDLRSMVERQSIDAVKNSTLTQAEVQGKMITSFQGVPVKRIDALSANEAEVA